MLTSVAFEFTHEIGQNPPAFIRRRTWVDVGEYHHFDAEFAGAGRTTFKDYIRYMLV